MKKEARSAFHPHPGKDPRTRGDPDSFYGERPSWRISRLDMRDPYGWHAVDPKTLGSIRDKLASIKTRTWSAILVESKKQNHLVPVVELSKAARDRLDELKLDDLQELLSLRLSGPERVWGILDRGVVTLLWWDPLHKVCTSILKKFVTVTTHAGSGSRRLLTGSPWVLSGLRNRRCHRRPSNSPSTDRD